MAMVHFGCTRCGAPLRISEGQRLIICAYCDATMLAATPSAASVASTVAPAPIAPADVERIKSLVLDGKRDEAIGHCAAVSGVSHREAEETVNQLMLPAIGDLIRHMPINALGFAIGIGMIGIGAALAAFGVSLVLEESYGGAALALLGSLLAYVGVRYLVPKAISSWINAYGATGRAVIYKRAILRDKFARDGVLLLVLFEVTPDNGGGAFFDQETLLVSQTRIDRLEVGNIVRVRFNEPARTRVFPVTPLEVIGHASRDGVAAGQ
jgi:hypothetical protein